MINIGFIDSMLLLVVVAFVAVPLVFMPKIARKAGFRPSFAELALAMIFTPIAILLFAFSHWPICHEQQSSATASSEMSEG